MDENILLLQTVIKFIICIIIIIRTDEKLTTFSLDYKVLLIRDMQR